MDRAPSDINVDDVQDMLNVLDAVQDTAPTSSKRIRLSLGIASADEEANARDAIQDDMPSSLFEAKTRECLPLTGSLRDLIVEAFVREPNTMSVGSKTHKAFVTFESAATAAIASQMVHSVPQHKAVLQVSSYGFCP